MRASASKGLVPPLSRCPPQPALHCLQRGQPALRGVVGGAAKTPSPTEAILAQGRAWDRLLHRPQTQLRACRQERRPVRAAPSQERTDSLRLAQLSLSPETARTPGLSWRPWVPSPPQAPELWPQQILTALSDPSTSGPQNQPEPASLTPLPPCIPERLP